MAEAVLWREAPVVLLKRHLTSTQRLQQSTNAVKSQTIRCHCITRLSLAELHANLSSRSLYFCRCTTLIYIAYMCTLRTWAFAKIKTVKIVKILHLQKFSLRIVWVHTVMSVLTVNITASINCNWCVFSTYMCTIHADIMHIIKFDTFFHNVIVRAYL